MAASEPTGRPATLEQAVERLLRAMPFDRQLLLAGVLVGVATGVAAYVLHVTLAGFESLRERFAASGAVLGVLSIAALPGIGGLISGWLTRRRFPEAGGHGIAEVARAINEKDGKVSAHVSWVKTLASAATIGFGGSAGLEGPVVQIGASVGSLVGRLFETRGRELRTFVAAGATGGLSAAYGIPLAGVFFTMEVILKDFANEAFPAVVVASVTGAVVARMLVGGAVGVGPAVVAQWTRNSDLLLYALLGLICAQLGRSYFDAIHYVEHLYERWERLPAWMHPAIGGFLVGALTLAVPLIGGTGETTSQAMLAGHALGWHAIPLALGKIAATALTLGTGGSGGALTPSLFVGAAAGSGWGEAAMRLGVTTSSAGAFALAGMCACFTAAFSAPITGMMIGVEMTREYGLLMPVMICCAIAYLSSRRRVEHIVVPTADAPKSDGKAS
ncbi:MAG: chloride channel protein [Elusimicrobia bacterium]|nr:chloride channel protein [Elusimicrobiota bacterium]